MSEKQMSLQWQMSLACPQPLPAPCTTDGKGSHLGTGGQIPRDLTKRHQKREEEELSLLVLLPGPVAAGPGAGGPGLPESCV